MEFFHDFYYVYCASELLNSGQSPYDSHTLQKCMYASGWGTSLSAVGFPQPPWIIPWIIWLAILPPLSALISNALIGLVTLAFLSYHTWSRSKSLQSLRLSELLITCLLFFPFFKIILYGQTAYLSVLGVWLGCILLLNSKSPFLAGMVFTLASIRPYVAIPLCGYALIASHPKNWLRCAAGFIVGLGFEVFFAWLIRPSIFSEFFSYVSEFTLAITTLPCPTFARVLHAQTGVELGTPLWILFLVASFAFVWRYYRGSGLIPKWPAALSVVMAPYLWSHDFAVLFPFYLMLCAEYRDKSPRHLQFLILGQFLLGTLALLRPGWEQLLIVIPLLLGFLLRSPAFNMNPSKDATQQAAI